VALRLWRRTAWLVVIAALAIVTWVWFQERSASKKASAANQRKTPAIPVTAAVARTGSIDVAFTGLGTVTPLATITVKTRIDGELMEVNYHEGDNIRKGAQLVQIDPRPFQVQLEQAEAQLAKDQAALANARIDLQRYETLIAKNAVAQQILITQRSTVQQDEASVKLDQAGIDSARLNLIYCRPTAPVSGRVGLRLVDPGNFVSAAAGTPLAVITQMQPMSVVFTLPSSQIQTVIDRRRANPRLRVDALNRDMTRSLATGALTTLDNQLDPTTGTLKMRATFANNDERLIPNQFVNARLLVETKTGVTLVPNAAVQRNGTSTFVYVVKPNRTVTVRQVKVGTTDARHSEITSGLQPGDAVVTQGVDRLTEGAVVDVHQFEDGNTIAMSP
jgi:membrane fusion protein, multidrug efflux system